MTIEIDGVNNTLKTDKIEPQSGTALQVGASGDTITLPSGATLNIAGTITNSGTATGFGALDWQTSDVKTSTFTAVAGKGYLVNTTGGAITVNLPAGSAGAQIALADYAGTWDTNNCTVVANGSEKIQGTADDAVFSRDREALQILYVDSTQGWIITSVADQGGIQSTYIAASGGTETTSGDYKIHTFTGSGTFTVSSVGNSSGGGDKVSYVVVAGGAGGGGRHGGGGGAGGFREGKVSSDPYSASPLNAPDGLTVSAQGYPITIGAGGSGVTSPPMDASATNGAASVFSTITSTGGGHGGGYASQGNVAEPGGSGGGGGGSIPCSSAGGSGNTPPVSPPQGSSGGSGASGGCSGAGAGGATAAGAATSITGSPVTRAGGGGGCPTGPAVPGGGTVPGGAGGGGNGVGHACQVAGNGTANTGGGGGGNRSPGGNCGASGAGGSGIVVIRYKYQN